MGAKNSRRFEFKLGKTGLTVFILSLSLLVFFSFIFGVTVGKNIEAYPEKWARGIPMMIKERLGLMSGQDDQLANKPIRDGKTTKDEKKDFDLTFYDTLTGKKSDKDHVGVGSRKVVKSSDSDAKKQIRSNVTLRPTKIDASKEKNTEKSTDPASQTISGSDKKVSLPGAANISKEKATKDGDKYLIQVVSFQEKGKADGISKKLTGLGYQPLVVTAEIPGKGQWFRVVLTGFDSRQDAQRISAAVEKSLSGIRCVVLAE
ncbi:MAG: SPOR domain-containing protein [Deltaproteobacteria bacterium]|nr:SPOR domain-containing protein [Deltaproteobacteria bacterium]